MKNSSQLITTILSVLFFGYIFYTYTPVEKVEKPTKSQSEAFGLWSFWLIDIDDIKKDGGFDAKKIEISNRGEVDLIINLMKEYNKMNTSGVTSFFADSCAMINLNGLYRQISHQDFETFFNKLDSVEWHPIAMVPLKLKEYKTDDPKQQETQIVLHSSERRYMKNDSIWTKELIEIFSIWNGKIAMINQFGRDYSEYTDRY